MKERLITFDEFIAAGSVQFETIGLVPVNNFPDLYSKRSVKRCSIDLDREQKTLPEYFPAG